MMETERSVFVLGEKMVDGSDSSLSQYLAASTQQTLCFGNVLLPGSQLFFFFLTDILLSGFSCEQIFLIFK